MPGTKGNAPDARWGAERPELGVRRSVVAQNRRIRPRAAGINRPPHRGATATRPLHCVRAIAGELRVLIDTPRTGPGFYQKSLRNFIFRKDARLAPPFSCLTTPDAAGTPSSPGARPSLLLRVRGWQDKVSWNEFHAIDRQLIDGLGRRSGLSPADTEDVTQDVSLRLAATIHPVEANPARGSFRRGLMPLPRWRIAHRRTRQRSPGDASAGSIPWAHAASATRSPQPPLDRLAAPCDFEAGGQEEWATHALDLACARLARRVKPPQEQVFERYPRRGRPVPEASRTLGVNPASGSLIGSRLTRPVKAEVTARRTQPEHS